MSRFRRILGPSLTHRRALFALLVGLLTAGATGGIIGFAAADDEAPVGLPETITVPERKVGDHAWYTLTVVRNGPDGPEVVEAEKPILEFEWLPDRLLRDGDGVLHRANELRILRHQWNATHVWTPYEHTPSFDAVTGIPFAYSYVREPETQVQNGSAFTDSNRQTFFTRPGELVALPFCGILNRFQGTTVDVTGEREIYGMCELTPYWTPEVVVEPMAAEVLDGRPTVAFGEAPAFVRGYPPRHIVWMSEELPYPVKMVVREQDDPTLHDVVRLVAFVPGETPMLHVGPDADPDPPTRIAWAPRQAWGPDDSDLEHPFPLSAAFARARDEPNETAVRDFLNEHPDAYVQEASYHEVWTDGYNVTRQWLMVFAGGSRGLCVHSLQYVESSLRRDFARSHDLLRDVVWQLPDPTNQTTYATRLTCRAEAEDVPALALPPRMPTAGSLQAVWKQYASPDYLAQGPNAWGFSLRCGSDVCAEARARYRGGLDLRVGEYDWPDLPFGLDPAPTTVTQHHYRSNVQLDAEGRVTDYAEWTSVYEPANGSFPGPGGGEGRPSVAPSSFEVSLWTLPSGKYAVATGLVAVLAGLVYWLWPSLKGLVAAPLFSRIERPAALHHPARAHILALVEAQPGIHFQEITRRLEMGRGAAHHHLRKLVHVGLVSEQSGNGYLCYFAKGRVDRRLMETAPLLKSAGARNLLTSATVQPGLSSLQLAAAARLDPATVSYHLRRLADFELVRLERAGRELRVWTTDLGRTALAQATPT